MNLTLSKRRTITALCTALLIAGCASIPDIKEVPDPPVDQGAIIGIRVSNSSPRMYLPPEGVYFVRLDNQSLLGQEILRSNFRIADRMYLLNAAPGTYVAIGNVLNAQTGPTAKITTYFARDLVEKTRITVAPGEFAFMGALVFEGSRAWSAGDDVQTHYRKHLAPDAVAGGVANSIMQHFSVVVAAWEKLSHFTKDDQSRTAFLLQAREDLAGSEWIPLISEP